MENVIWPVIQNQSQGNKQLRSIASERAWGPWEPEGQIYIIHFTHTHGRP
jgi:hypothetical protein